MSALTVADISDAMASAFLALSAGQKHACPVCAKRVMFQSYQTLFGSGLGQHIRSAHPEYEPAFHALAERHKHAVKLKAAAKAKEAIERPLRDHVVTGAFLDEVSGEINSLIGMMEPYWSQGNASDSAYDLLERIKRIQDEAAAIAKAVQS